VTVWIGIDIGQGREPTALCVAEDETRPGSIQPEVHYLIRYLTRLPVGTPYPRIADRLREVTLGVAARSGETPIVYADITGFGLPVVDTLKGSVPQCRVVPVFFNHGDRYREESGEIRLGKAHLVSKLQALLQAGQLHLPQTREAEVLAEELRDYEIRVTDDANERDGAFRVGTHDDLVTALGLAVCHKPPPVFRIF
jgi:hypothetical protein